MEETRRARGRARARSHPLRGRARRRPWRWPSWAPKSSKSNDADFEPSQAALNRLVVNSNKKSITLDLKTQAGHDTVLELAKQCDVFIENFSPGVIERLGLDYATVSAVNPRLIYAQVKGYASDSPYANFPCFEPAAQAYAGSTSFTGHPDGPPTKPGPDLADNGTGLMTAMGIIAALYQRQTDRPRPTHRGRDDRSRLDLHPHPLRLSDRAERADAAPGQLGAVHAQDRPRRGLSLQTVRAERLSLHAREQ